MVHPAAEAPSDTATLDAVFAALSDPTRRAVLETLGERSLSVTELAEPHGMSLTGFMKHLRVLEGAGLIARTKEGRVVRCALSPQPMQEAAAWLSRYEKFWTDRLDALARFLYHQEETEWQTLPTQEPGKSAPRSPSAGTTASRPTKSGARGPTRKR
ncbi:ArsR/SmtB family transcription factor [Variovorax sp. VaC1]|uniref:ArsR/SmtB family transcription factor n=1 Tax=Variovorax sp. VaC1 TaxID=3373132 RepID=UPI0037492B25